jgi:hypothetical protein
MRAARDASSPSTRAEGSLPSMRAAPGSLPSMRSEGSLPSTRAAREGSPPSMRAARPGHAFDAMAVDVSERGMKLEVVGASLKALLDSSDSLVRLEVTLAHAQLGPVAPFAGHVQWRGPGGDRNSWTLGARFDAPIPAHVLSQILRHGAPIAKGTSALPALGLGVVAILVAIGWYRSRTEAAVESENAARRLSSTEDDLAEVKSELERCRSRPMAPPVAAVAPFAAPAPTGAVPRPDVAPLGRADAGSLMPATIGASIQGVPDAWTTATDSRNADADKED